MAEGTQYPTADHIAAGSEQAEVEETDETMADDDEQHYNRVPGA